MLLDEFLKLKNGSDIRGVAIDGVKNESVNLTDEKITAIGAAFVLWLSKKYNKSPKNLILAIGNDSRLSANRIKKALIEGISPYGSSIYDCGLCSTPSMFMTTIDTLNADGSIQITASHLPFNRNGLKFFTKDGGLEGTDISEILGLASETEFTEISTQNNVKLFNFTDRYSEILREKITKETNSEKPFNGLKIVVDAGNGAGGFFAEKVLMPLGADITGSQFLEPDGSFPNHIPNPEDKEAMKAISDCVIQNKADLGIIFDTDVDRAAVVDKTGKEINKNRLIALICAILFDSSEGSTVVTDSITSSGLKEFIENNLKSKHHRFKRGYKNVINEAKRLNSEGIYTPIAIETSGHCAFLENYFLDDGAYLITKILIALANLNRQGKELFSLIKDLKEPFEAKEYRFKIETENFKEYGQSVLDDLLVFCKDKGYNIEPNNFEGVRVSFNKENGNGWFLLRLSLHDPILPLNIESDSEGGLEKIEKIIFDFLKKYDKLKM